MNKKENIRKKAEEIGLTYRSAKTELRNLLYFCTVTHILRLNDYDILSAFQSWRSRSPMAPDNKYNLLLISYDFSYFHLTDI